MEQSTRILFVEDSDFDRVSFERFVEDENLAYDWTTAASVSEAKKALTSERFDAVLVDHSLGDGTAFDLLDEIGDTPFVVITGTGDEHIAVSAMKAGAADYLIKDLQSNHLKTLAVTVENAVARRRDQLALRKQQQEWRSLVENAPDYIMIIGRDNRIQFLNHPTPGSTEEEAMGRSVLEYVPLGYRDLMRESLRQVFSTGAPVAFEIGVDLPNASRSWLAVRLGPIKAEGEVVAAIHIASDITQHRRTEEELAKHKDRLQEVVEQRTAELVKANEGLEREILERKQAEERLRLLSSAVQQSTEGIAISDLEGNLQFVNDAFAAMHGYTPGELLGKHVSIFHSPDQMPSVEAANRQIQEVGDFNGEIWHVRRNGKVFPGWMSNSLLRDETGKPAGMIGTLTDISERKRAEEQIRASLWEKEVLLREIHHRVKNNMQVVSSLLSLQSRHLADERALAIFKETQDRVTSMAKVHEQLYHSGDLAKVDFEEHVRNLALHLFRSYGVASTAVAFKADIEDVPLTLDVAIPCGLIVNELVSNALKHAFPAGRKGEIRVGLAFENERITLVVSDNGTGFPPDLDFRTAPSMGLQVVSTLVRQLEGTVELDRQSGTTLKITFRQPERAR